MSTKNPSINGILHPELFIGVISYVSASNVKANLSSAGFPCGSHFAGGRYGKGEVGEFVLIEGQTTLLLGRIIEVRLPETDRKTLKPDKFDNINLDAIGTIQLLGTVAMDSLKVKAGIDKYPRLGDRVYSAPHRFISEIPLLMNRKNEDNMKVMLSLGEIDISEESEVIITPEKLFGRHCAILGATGGGKSWTTARIIEECIKYKSKIILLDPTGEYRDFAGEHIIHCNLGEVSHDKIAEGSIDCSLPVNSFTESDFIALFRPSPGIQFPKLRQAMISLRIVHYNSSFGKDGLFIKENKPYSEITPIISNPDVAEVSNNPNSPFDVTKIIGQIRQECAWENENGYGRINEQQWGQCQSLVSRISNIIYSKHLSFIFRSEGKKPVTDLIKKFTKNEKRLLRICLAGVSYEFQSREIVANAIGRYLLNLARNGEITSPIVLIVDEAHNFLGRNINSEDSMYRLDAIGLIAKEGRKYGLNICLSTQRPRDIPEDVLSQMGTLVVHRLVNDSDREVVERACGEIDRAATSFLPNLKPGEAAIIGIDFPIPLTVQVRKPSTPPKSDGPDYQRKWQDS